MHFCHGRHTQGFSEMLMVLQSRGEIRIQEQEMECVPGTTDLGQDDICLPSS